ncbi:MAG TPA: fused uroporphyrinogen-III synthase HemD/membrane protein HemX [Burkholderiales bacterium]|nr:fused uroporphyrinogen-III synthase HemD/membrane protein HemX [Burkholderiales bacterium]
MERKPLQGRGVVVTRPAGQAERLAALVSAAGGRPIVFAAIEIERLPERPLPPLEEFELVVFVSPTAVDCGFERIRHSTVRLAALGSGTRRALQALGERDVIAPEDGADSEALLALPELHDVAGKRILIVRGEGGRELLGDTLAARGARTEYLECYRRVLPHADPAPLIAAWDRGEVDALTVSSSAGLDNLITLLGVPRLAGKPIFVNHPRVAERARDAGIPELIVAGPGDEETAEALVAYFGSPRMEDRQEDRQEHRQPQEQAPENPQPRRARTSWLLLIAIVLVAALATVFWLDARQRIGATQQELARRLRDIEGDAREARSVARQSEDGQRETRAKLGQLEARVAESQSQQLALEALYQELSRNRDEWQLAEIEQVLTIASQQLQLAGNVRAALLALQLAEQRLARADRPQFLPIRRALARDIDRLKTLPTLDLAGMSMRIDILAAQVDALPLAFDERAEREPPAKEAAAADERGFWSRLSAEVWNELRQLVVVRQVGNAEPPLLPPSQAYFVRENLRLRLLNARLSLLARDEAGYREDLRIAQSWIQRYFDPRSKQTAAALNQLRQLSSTSVSFELPSITESLEAVRGYKSRRERQPG